MESVPFRQIAIFTVFQLMYLMLCFGITWIPIAGILFPLPFFILISIRQHVLPRFFHPRHLWELDAAEYEEIAGVPYRERNLSFGDQDRSYQIGRDETNADICDAEILDDLTTSRGELKHRSTSFQEDRSLQDLQVHPEIKHVRSWWLHSEMRNEEINKEFHDRDLIFNNRNFFFPSCLVESQWGDS